MSKHTPGPWEAKIHSDPQWGIMKKGEDFHYIAITSQGNDEANALLIAAVPDLLRGCMAALAYWDSPFPENQETAKEIIRAAIAKAGADK